jgi:hypothetical protein
MSEQFQIFLVFFFIQAESVCWNTVLTVESARMILNWFTGVLSLYIHSVQVLIAGYFCQVA